MLLSTTYTPPPYDNVVINWFEEIKRLVPNAT